MPLLTRTAHQTPLTEEGAAQIEDIVILFPRTKRFFFLVSAVITTKCFSFKCFTWEPSLLPHPPQKTCMSVALATSGRELAPKETVSTVLVQASGMGT